MELTLNKLYKRYDKYVLKEITINISNVQSIGIIGKSGCGKSTTYGLLERFYLPDSGSIKIDGYNIEDLNLNWLREQIALVAQEPSLFTGTIK